MKKRIFWLVCAIWIGTYGYAQNLHVTSADMITISTGDALYILGNYTTSGAFSGITVQSDATKSGSLIVSGTGATATYNRYIDDTNWHVLSPPFSSGAVADFVTDGNNAVNFNGGTGNYAVARYKNTNVAGSRWTYHNNTPTQANQETLTNFASGSSYSMNRTSAGTFSFTGNVESSDVMVSITNGSTGHYWAAIGNPYAAFLPANDNAAGTNVLGENISVLDASFAALYVWNGTQYDVMNQASPSYNLAPGQGFLVRVKDADETFTFSESLRTHISNTDQFSRNANLEKKLVVTISNGAQSKTTEVKYLNNATTGLDVGYDAATYVDSAPSLAIDTHLVTDSEGLDFTLQCLPDGGYESQVIPLAVKADAGTQLQFSAIVSNLPEDLDVYLEDTETNTFTKINENAYAFVPDQALYGIGRFYLHISPQALSTDDLSSTQVINIYKADQFTVRITGLTPLTPANVALYNIQGQTIFTQRLETQRVQDIQLPTYLAKGVYVFVLDTEKGKETLKLIID